MNNATPDKKSIMMYVMCLYQALPHAKIPLVPTNGSGSPSRETLSDSAAVSLPFPNCRRKLTFVFLLPLSQASQSFSSSDQVDLSAYQTLMEEVLVWLLAADDHLDSASSNFTDLQIVKEQFHKHEV